MASAVVLLAFAFQAAVAQNSTPAVPTARVASPPTPVAWTRRAAQPPVIDGRDDDAVWREIEPITAFREWQPHEDTDPRFQTEARITYDDRNLYAFVRAYDPHPDSILKLLARRDAWTPSDKIWLEIDSYHDRRSGFEFGVNAAGVKIDIAITDDGNEDDAWDAVWDVATTVDSLGWTAEYRIPLSQLRFAPSDSVTFGFMVIRDVQRFTERFSWPVLRRSRTGFTSQFGELRGLTGLSSPRRLEVTPYAVTKSVSVANASGGYDREPQMTGGADIKYGLTSNLTLDGTVNPDFGQVEADPAVLNLTAFETFFPERRPFFIEGTGIFRFNVNCSAVNCGGEGLFYSRRIGRSPQMAGDYGDANSPTATTILGAAKLTGRLANGLSLGLLEGVTQQEVGTQNRTIEPSTNYLAARAIQDLRGGESGVGVMFTAVNRNLDQWNESALRSSAYVGALNFRHRFAGKRYQATGSLDFSTVQGTAQAIDATQTSSVHYYQRPDAGVTYDPTRTKLGGNAQEFSFGKVGGQVTRWETAYLRRSVGFEVNDLGFLQRADQQSWSTWFSLNGNKPTKIYQRAFWNFNWWQYWTTTGGLPTERAFNTNLHAQLNSRWWIHTGGTVGGLGATYCDFDCTRGGPALRRDAFISPWAGIQGDDRKKYRPSLFFNYYRGDGGRSYSANVNPEVEMRVSSQLNTSLGISLTKSVSDQQSYGNFTDSLGNTSYTIAHLPQLTGSVNFRFDYTMSRTLSLQVYAQPFVSKGSYSDIRAVTNPRAPGYDDRFSPYTDTAVTNNPGGVNFKQFRSNVVLRWEYRPGSTLFFVWTQGRQDFQSAEGQGNLRDNFSHLFDLRPDNTLLIKASYWLSW
jgi:hypothetical protein